MEIQEIIALVKRTRAFVENREKGRRAAGRPPPAPHPTGSAESGALSGGSLGYSGFPGNSGFPGISGVCVPESEPSETSVPVVVIASSPPVIRV